MGIGDDDVRVRVSWLYCTFLCVITVTAKYGYPYPRIRITYIYLASIAVHLPNRISTVASLM